MATNTDGMHPRYLGWQVDCKVCTSCSKNLPLSEFYTHKQGKFGKRSKCKSCYKTVIQGWKDKNPEKVHQYTMTSRGRNREGYRNSYNKWQAQNRDRKNSKEARRRAYKLQASPEWMTEKDKDDILAIYSLAKKFESIFGIKYHVDHIVPLKGENVCGLHVPWNLQILPASINIRKSNKTLEDF